MSKPSSPRETKAVAPSGRPITVPWSCQGTPGSSAAQRATGLHDRSTPTGRAPRWGRQGGGGGDVLDPDGNTAGTTVSPDDAFAAIDAVVAAAASMDHGRLRSPLGGGRAGCVAARPVQTSDRPWSPSAWARLSVNPGSQPPPYMAALVESSSVVQDTPPWWLAMRVQPTQFVPNGKVPGSQSSRSALRLAAAAPPSKTMAAIVYIAGRWSCAVLLRQVREGCFFAVEKF